MIILSGGLMSSADLLLPLIQTYVSSLSWTILPSKLNIVTGSSLSSAGVVGSALAAANMLS